MPESTPPDLLQPIRARDARTGAAIDPALFEHLVTAFHQDLRRVAQRERYRLRAGRTLCTTALVNETWLKLRHASGWNDVEHFMRTAAMAMRQVLVNDATTKRTEKRNHGQVAMSLDDLPDSAQPADASGHPDLLALDHVLRELERLSPRLAQVVECRYFGGYSDTDTARALGVTERTVRRDWLKARAWLYQRLSAEPEQTGIAEQTTAT